jgi:6-pyruvoyltetrahydropterin/6-carboxytetrahydropterin synthase
MMDGDALGAKASGTLSSSTSVFREFTFEAAHRLVGVAPEHKCARLHGHSFRVEIHVGGEVDPVTGMVIDFACISKSFAAVHDVLDHRYLNEIGGLENPTSENLARWIWDRLAPELTLETVVVRETCNSGAVYRGPAMPPKP